MISLEHNDLGFQQHLSGQLKLLQRRFDLLEDELHKKRAELREALRQDVVVQG